MLTANVVLIAFLLISIAVFGFLGLLVRQIKKDGQLSQDKMTKLTALLFVPAILVFGLIFYGLSSWRAEIKAQKIQNQVEQFVIKVYKPLADSQKTLLQTARDMRKWLDGVERLRGEFPNHQELLQKIEQQWLESQQRLFRLYKDTDKEIRHAWISYNTLDQQDVFGKFYTRAVQLNEQIAKVNKDNQLNIRGVQDDLVNSIDQARRLLNAPKKKKSIKHRKKSRKKQSIKLKNKQAPEIMPFSRQAVNTLLEFLSARDKALAMEVRKLQENIRIASQRHEEVIYYLKDNPDLQLPLQKVLSGWNALQGNDQKALNLILYALEADYLAQKLGLSRANPAMKALHKQFKSRIPAIVNQARKQREALERSYSIKNK